MRLGAYPTELEDGSFAHRAYGSSSISERHRHRYEVNQEFMPQLRQAGMRFTGMSPDGKFVEMVEYANHPWFLACQFHPEYKSKPLDPHPLFRDFIAAAYEYQRNRLTLGRSDSPDAYAAS
jgi:CTP synthase